MHSVWYCILQLYQLPTIAHIMCTMSNNIDPAPVLVVQYTGSGKSLVPLTCSVIDSDITYREHNSINI